jgi:hypothetical protein
MKKNILVIFASIISLTGFAGEINSVSTPTVLPKDTLRSYGQRAIQYKVSATEYALLQLMYNSNLVQGSGTGTSTVTVSNMLRQSTQDSINKVARVSNALGGIAGSSALTGANGRSVFYNALNDETVLESCDNIGNISTNIFNTTNLVTGKTSVFKNTIGHSYFVDTVAGSYMSSANHLYNIDGNSLATLSALGSFYSRNHADLLGLNSLLVTSNAQTTGINTKLAGTLTVTVSNSPSVTVTNTVTTTSYYQNYSDAASANINQKNLTQDSLSRISIQHISANSDTLVRGFSNSQRVVITGFFNTDGQVLYTPSTGKNFYITDYDINMICFSATATQIQLNDNTTPKITLYAGPGTGSLYTQIKYNGNLRTPIVIGTSLKVKYIAGSNATGSFFGTITGYYDN